MPVFRYSVGSIPEFYKKVKNFSGNETHVWYRGQKHHYYNLQPYAFRYPKYRKQSRVLEGDSIARSQSSFYHFPNTRHLVSDLNWMCYMQHIGIPTRLLDWTIDPSVALFFAFESYLDKPFSKPGGMPCIWVLKITQFVKELKTLLSNKNDPIKCTKHQRDNLIEFFSSTPHPKTVREFETFENKLGKYKSFENVYIPLISPIVHERPKVQGGCFIRFPLLDNQTDNEFENYYLDNFMDNIANFNCLAQFVFTKPLKTTSELTTHNLDTSRIYPEEINIANRIKWHLFQDEY